MLEADEIPSGPKPRLISGHLYHFRKDMLGFLTSAAAEYGDFVPLRFGHKRAVFVNHPEYVRSFLVAQQRNFVKSDAFRILSRLVGDGLITSDGEFWRRQRRLVQPAFHRDRVDSYAAGMVERAARMADRWSPGDVRDIDHDMLQVALEIVSHSLLRADMANNSVELAAAVTAAREATDAIWNSLQVFLPARLPTPANLKLRRAIRLLDEVVYKIIDDRRRQEAAGDDLLGMLLSAQDEYGEGMTDKQVRDEVITIFLAGHETTAVTLSWAFYLLGRHPTVDEQLADELVEVLGDRTPTVEDIPKLKLATSIVSETLRLYPPATLIGRRALENCKIGGYSIPADTTILASPWVLHRDGRYFEAPDVFDPHRWDDDLEDRLPRVVYFPFGAGPRRCIGNRFAMVEQVLVLATLAQRYRLLPESDEVVQPNVAVTLHPNSSIRMRLEERTG